MTSIAIKGQSFFLRPQIHLIGQAWLEDLFHHTDPHTYCKKKPVATRKDKIKFELSALWAVNLDVL